ncbi:hypothetical protein TcCL_Unassigned00779 [Trypanosoma cruzi]|nr:hypothetical protein TcCL_Unassigned00779 [Trypanosoma cruzi]
MLFTLSACPITDNKNNSALSQKEKKTQSHRPAAGQHSPPPTAIAAQETAVTSQSQHHNVHHTVVHRAMGWTRPRIAPLHFPTHQFLRARTKWQTQSKCTQTNSPPHSLKHIISHEMTFKHTAAVAGCTKFPFQPCERTQQLCGVKVAAPRCCPQFTWKDKLHTHIVPDSSLPECTSTEQVKRYFRARRHLNTRMFQPVLFDGVGERPHTVQSKWHVGKNGVS